jgi:hypothetical protein
MRNINLQVVKKDMKTWKIVIKKNKIPVDISGWSLYFTCKTDFNDADSAAIITKNVTFPSNAESQAGIGYLSLTSTDTDVTIGEYFYDIKLIDTLYRETFMRGKLNILFTVRKA